MAEDKKFQEALVEVLKDYTNPHKAWVDPNDSSKFKYKSDPQLDASVRTYLANFAYPMFKADGRTPEQLFSILTDYSQTPPGENTQEAHAKINAMVEKAAALPNKKAAMEFITDQMINGRSEGNDPGNFRGIFKAEIEKRVDAQLAKANNVQKAPAPKASPVSVAQTTDVATQKTDARAEGYERLKKIVGGMYKDEADKPVIKMDGSTVTFSFPIDGQHSNGAEKGVPAALEFERKMGNFISEAGVGTLLKVNRHDTYQTINGFSSTKSRSITIDIDQFVECKPYIDQWQKNAPPSTYPGNSLEEKEFNQKVLKRGGAKQELEDFLDVNIDYDSQSQKFKITFDKPEQAQQFREDFRALTGSMDISSGVKIEENNDKVVSFDAKVFVSKDGKNRAAIFDSLGQGVSLLKDDMTKPMHDRHDMSWDVEKKYKAGIEQKKNDAASPATKNAQAKVEKLTKLEKALTDYNNATISDPKSAERNTNLVTLLFKPGDHDGNIALMQEEFQFQQKFVIQSATTGSGPKRAEAMLKALRDNGLPEEAEALKQKVIKALAENAAPTPKSATAKIDPLSQPSTPSVAAPQPSAPVVAPVPNKTEPAKTQEDPLRKMHVALAKVEKSASPENVQAFTKAYYEARKPYEDKSGNISAENQARFEAAYNDANNFQGAKKDAVSRAKEAFVKFADSNIQKVLTADGQYLDKAVKESLVTLDTNHDGKLDRVDSIALEAKMLKSGANPDDVRTKIAAINEALSKIQLNGISGAKPALTVSVPQTQAKGAAPHQKA